MTRSNVSKRVPDERLDRQRERDREYARKRYANDPNFAEQQRAYQRTRRASDPQKASESRKRSYAKHAAKRRAERQAYYRANQEAEKEKARIRYAEARKSDVPYRPNDRSATPELRALRKSAVDKRWRDENRERYRRNKANTEARRRAQKRGLPNEKIDREEIYERDRGRCHLCRRKVSHRTFHIDHLVPLSKGGPHVASNVAIAHPRCNLLRGDGRRPAQLLLEG